MVDVWPVSWSQGSNKNMVDIWPVSWSQDSNKNMVDIRPVSWPQGSNKNMVDIWPVSWSQDSNKNMVDIRPVSWPQGSNKNMVVTWPVSWPQDSNKNMVVTWPVSWSQGSNKNMVRLSQILKQLITTTRFTQSNYRVVYITNTLYYSHLLLHRVVFSLQFSRQFVSLFTQIPYMRYVALHCLHLILGLFPEGFSLTDCPL